MFSITSTNEPDELSMNLHHVFSSAVLVRLKVPLPGTSHHASKVLRGIPLHLRRECGGRSVVESGKVEVTVGSKTR